MGEQPMSDVKVQKPCDHFDEAQEVVADSSLSKGQKVKALNTLEQDARQLAEASSEGMQGGDSNNLHEVLVAKDLLALASLANAYETVLRDLRSRQKDEVANTARVLLDEAIRTLDGIVDSFAQPLAQR